MFKLQKYDVCKIFMIYFLLITWSQILIDNILSTFHKQLFQIHSLKIFLLQQYNLQMIFHWLNDLLLWCTDLWLPLVGGLFAMLDLSTLYSGKSSSMDAWRLPDADFGFEGLVSSTASTSWMDGFLSRPTTLPVVPESLSSFTELRLGSEVNSGLSRIILRDPEVKGLGLFSLRFLPVS